MRSRFASSCTPRHLRLTDGDMIQFSIFGIPVTIQPFFWLVLIIFGASGGADSVAEIFQILLFVLAGFVSILVHELGHALTARRFGANTSITLEGFGGFASYSGVRMSRLQSFLITAAGPVIQIALGFTALVAVELTQLYISENGFYFLKKLMAVSFFWAALNLLPVLPLDGGHMLGAVLGPARIRITLWVTIIVSITVGLVMLVKLGPSLFPIFLGMFAYQAYQGLNDSRWR